MNDGLVSMYFLANSSVYLLKQHTFLQTFELQNILSSAKHVSLNYDWKQLEVLYSVES